MTLVKKHLRRLAAMMVVTAFAMCLLPSMAFAVTNITVDYNGSYSRTIDLESISASETMHKYQYFKNGAWTVLGTNDYVTLTGLENAYVAAVQDEWGSAIANTISSNFNNSTLNFSTTDFPYPSIYNKYNSGDFPVSDLLNQDNGFWGDTLWNSTPVSGTPDDVETVFALNEASSGALTSGTCGSATLGTPSTLTYARLFWGIPDTSWSAFGGNRFPSLITNMSINY